MARPTRLRCVAARCSPRMPKLPKASFLSVGPSFENDSRRRLGNSVRLVQADRKVANGAARSLFTFSVRYSPILENVPFRPYSLRALNDLRTPAKATSDNGGSILPRKPLPMLFKPAEAANE